MFQLIDFERSLLDLMDSFERQGYAPGKGFVVHSIAVGDV
jgi:hypothetical protein